MGGVKEEERSMHIHGLLSRYPVTTLEVPAAAVIGSEFKLLSLKLIADLALDESIVM